jgi:hypothetical protein
VTAAAEKQSRRYSSSSSSSSPSAAANKLDWSRKNCKTAEKRVMELSALVITFQSIIKRKERSGGLSGLRIYVIRRRKSDFSQD